MGSSALSSCYTPLQAVKQTPEELLSLGAVISLHGLLLMQYSLYFFSSWRSLLLIHRAVWPILIRTLFRMQDIGTKGRRAILTAVGVALLGLVRCSVEKVPELLKDLIKILGG